MTSTITDPAGIEKAIWLATATALVVAVLLTVVLHRMYVTRARTRLRLVTSGVAVLICLIAYAAAAIVWFATASILLNSAPSRDNGVQFSILTTYVHPGPLHKVLPLLAAVVTWIILAVRFRNGKAVPAG